MGSGEGPSELTVIVVDLCGGSTYYMPGSVLGMSIN